MAQKPGEQSKIGDQTHGLINERAREGEAQLIRHLFKDVSTAHKEHSEQLDPKSNAVLLKEMQEVTSQLHKSGVLPEDMSVAGVTKDGRLLVTDHNEGDKHKVYSLDQQGAVDGVFSIKTDAQGHKVFVPEHNKNNATPSDVPPLALPGMDKTSTDGQGNLIKETANGREIDRPDHSKEFYKKDSGSKDGYALVGREFPNGVKEDIDPRDPNKITKITEKDGSTWTPEKGGKWMHTDSNGQALEEASNVTVDATGKIKADNVQSMTNQPTTGDGTTGNLAGGDPGSDASSGPGGDMPSAAPAPGPSPSFSGSDGGGGGGGDDDDGDDGSDDGGD